MIYRGTDRVDRLRSLFRAEGAPDVERGGCLYVEVVIGPEAYRTRRDHRFLAAPMKSGPLRPIQEGCAAAYDEIGFREMVKSEGISVQLTMLVVVLGPGPIRNLTKCVLYFESPIPQLGSATLLIENAAACSSFKFHKHKVPCSRGTNHEIGAKRTLKIELMLVAIWPSFSSRKLDQQTQILSRLEIFDDTGLRKLGV